MESGKADSAPDDFRHISRAVESAGNHADNHLVDPDGSEDTEIDDQNLQQQRCAADQIDVHLREAAEEPQQQHTQLPERILPVIPQIRHIRQEKHRQDDSEQRSEKNREEAHLQGNPQTVQIQLPPVIPDDVRIDLLVDRLEEAEPLLVRQHGFNRQPPLFKNVHI